MASLTKDLNRASEFFSRFERFGGDEIKLKKLLGNDELMEAWVKRLDEFPEFQLVHGLFTKPEAQIVRINELRHERDWGIPDEWLNMAEKSVPKWPENELVSVNLVPYLHDKKDDEGRIMMSGLERTFHELWDVAAKQQHASYRWDGYDKAGPDRLQLHKGVHRVSLRWEVIDLGCNRNKKPMDVRNAKSSPHAGILAAAVLHPNWVKSMDGDKVPYVFAPGYEVQVPDEKPWASVPYLYFGSDSRGIQLDYSWCDECSSSWAVPSFFRE
ncbi:MAG: hypothetical protein WC766_04015 [Patescibacteria group bacterium]|jgi:hypothetical protein